MRSAIAIGFCLLTSVVHAQDATTGKSTFTQCLACHSVDGKPGIGPTLQGIVGRPAGSVADFRYSSALKNANLSWTAESLDAFVASPQKAVPGNAMPYAGLADAQQRKDLVAYLATLK